MNRPLLPLHTAIALHCSGASRRQWKSLGEALMPEVRVIAPDLAGYGDNPPAGATDTTSLAVEAEPVVELIDLTATPVHLVGHSYGAAVALKAALARPGRVASLTLYEPTAFRLLRDSGAEGLAALSTIEAVASAVTRDVEAGRGARAMALFYDFWQEDGAWQRLAPEVQTALAARVGKVPHDFAALMGDPMDFRHLRSLAMPVLVLRGELALPATRLLAERIARAIPRGRTIDVAGAGHMGPVTHRDQVDRLIASHVCHVARHAGPARHLAA
jgi:pimeloyl-ACP methyl ester carboxylesterase